MTLDINSSANGSIICLPKPEAVTNENGMEGKCPKCREREAEEEYYRDYYDPCMDEYYAREQFVNELIEKGAKRLMKKRFDVILTLIREQVAELSKVKSCGKDEKEITATIRDTTEVISFLGNRLS